MDQLFRVAGAITTIINGIIVPLVFAIAFLVFIWGVFQYFIAGGANEEKRKEGKNFILYGIIGFFIMVSVWGLVNVLVGTFGFGGQARPPLPAFDKSSAGQFSGGRPSTNSGSGSGSNVDLSSSGECGLPGLEDACGLFRDCIAGQCYSNSVGSGNEACLRGQCVDGFSCSSANRCVRNSSSGSSVGGSAGQVCSSPPETAQDGCQSGLSCEINSPRTQVPGETNPPRYIGTCR